MSFSHIFWDQLTGKSNELRGLVGPIQTRGTRHIVHTQINTNQDGITYSIDNVNCSPVAVWGSHRDVLKLANPVSTRASHPYVASADIRCLFQQSIVQVDLKNKLTILDIDTDRTIRDIDIQLNPSDYKIVGMDISQDAVIYLVVCEPANSSIRLLSVGLETLRTEPTFLPKSTRVCGHAKYTGHITSAVCKVTNEHAYAVLLITGHYVKEVNFLKWNILEYSAQDAVLQLIETDHARSLMSLACDITIRDSAAAHKLVTIAKHVITCDNIRPGCIAASNCNNSLLMEVDPAKATLYVHSGKYKTTDTYIHSFFTNAVAICCHPHDMTVLCVLSNLAETRFDRKKMVCTIWRIGEQKCHAQITMAVYNKPEMQFFAGTSCLHLAHSSNSMVNTTVPILCPFTTYIIGAHSYLDTNFDVVYNVIRSYTDLKRYI